MTVRLPPGFQAPLTVQHPDMLPGTAILCPRCMVPAEFVKQSEATTETRCPRCGVTLGLAFDPAEA